MDYEWENKMNGSVDGFEVEMPGATPDDTIESLSASVNALTYIAAEVTQQLVKLNQTVAILMEGQYLNSENMNDRLNYADDRLDELNDRIDDVEDQIDNLSEFKF